MPSCLAQKRAQRASSTRRIAVPREIPRDDSRARGGERLDSGEHGVQNVYYSHDGQFTQPLEPGKYDVIISYGPEHDAVFQQIEIERGRATPLAAHLTRSVDTRGWISADFHSHASPSGDNVSSQLGRVLNLLCEQIDFAPCTEHNRISTYEPHLERLGVSTRMATCSGIELTGNPLPLNHHNAFPLVRHDHTQDNGAPQPDVSPEVQIGRLALWDGRSEKLLSLRRPLDLTRKACAALVCVALSGVLVPVPFIDVAYMSANSARADLKP